MGLVRFINKAGVTLVDVVNLEIRHDGGVLVSPAEVITNLVPHQYPTNERSTFLFSLYYINNIQYCPPIITKITTCDIKAFVITTVTF